METKTRYNLRLVLLDSILLWTVCQRQIVRTLSFRILKSFETSRLYFSTNLVIRVTYLPNYYYRYFL